MGVVKLGSRNEGCITGLLETNNSNNSKIQSLKPDKSKKTFHVKAVATYVKIHTDFMRYNEE